MVNGEADVNPVKYDAYKHTVDDIVQRMQGTVTREQLLELVESGYAPCVRHSLTNAVFFAWPEIRAWIHKNYSRHQPGMDLPKRFAVFSHESTKSWRPDTLVSINPLCEYAFSDFPPCVYFLCDRHKVLYVGQSVALPARLLAHVADRKSFEKVFFIPVPKTLLSATETAFIQALKPILNNPDRGFRDVTEKERQILRHFGHGGEAAGAQDRPEEQRGDRGGLSLDELDRICTVYDEIETVNPDLLEKITGERK